jgi:DNA-directed RNA polymerase specialized sigma24 family protein
LRTAIVHRFTDAARHLAAERHALGDREDLERVATHLDAPDLDPVQGPQLEDWFRESLAHLPQKYAAMIIGLRNGYTKREIADAHDCSMRTVERAVQQWRAVSELECCVGAA